MISLLFGQILYWLSYFKLVVVVDIRESITNAQMHLSKIWRFSSLSSFLIMSTIRINGMVSGLNPVWIQHQFCNCNQKIQPSRKYMDIYLLFMNSPYHIESVFIKDILSNGLGWCHTNIIEKNMFWKSQLLKELHVVSVIFAS